MTPGPLSELQIILLNYLGDMGGATIHQLTTWLSSTHSLSRAAVRHLVKSLEQAGLVQKSRRGRSQFYQPLIKREVVRAEQVKHLLNSMFDSQAAQWVDPEIGADFSDVREAMRQISEEEETRDGETDPG